MNSHQISNRKYQLVVFDWDGTLADSVQQIVTAMTEAIELHGLAHPGSEQIAAGIGLGLQVIIEKLFPDEDRNVHMKIANSYREIYLSTAADNTTLFPDTELTLEILREHGYLLAIATGKSRRGLDRSLGHTNISGYFHMTRCADETFSKPHPQMLLEIMEFLDIPPEYTLMVGDTEHDLQMAGNANVPAIAVNYGAQPSRRLLEFNPVAVLSSLQELPAWLSRQ